MKHLGADEPLMQLLAALAERIMEALLRPGAETVDGQRKTLANLHFGHDNLPLRAYRKRAGTAQWCLALRWWIELRLHGAIGCNRPRIRRRLARASSSSFNVFKCLLFCPAAVPLLSRCRPGGHRARRRVRQRQALMTLIYCRLPPKSAKPSVVSRTRTRGSQANAAVNRRRASRPPRPSPDRIRRASRSRLPTPRCACP